MTEEEKTAKTRVRNHDYYERNKMALNARNRAYYAEHRKELLARAREKYAKNHQPKLENEQPPQEPPKTTGKGKPITIRENTRYRTIQVMLARRERLKNTPRCPICGDYQTNTILIRVCSTCGSRIAK